MAVPGHGQARAGHQRLHLYQDGPRSSSGTVTAEPALAVWRSLRKAADGLDTCRSPSASISKTPISLVEPKRFFSPQQAA